MEPNCKRESSWAFSLLLLLISTAAGENATRAPVKKSEARVEEGKGQFIIKDSKETNGATKDTVTVSRGDIKRRVKRTKAINPLVGRQKKKISNAKKAL